MLINTNGSFKNHTHVNYLTKTSAPKISISNLTEIKSVDNYLKNYVDNTNYFNVSISDKIYVVLCIGYSENSKYIGLGISNILEEAIKKVRLKLCSILQRILVRMLNLLF